ncbi:hypothetical protein LG299_12545 [Microbacterium lacus]|uniref:hypothetical protein n=1 Tax=Microbacterium lacus TaxID=415217 RepID=UPI00384D4DEE
MAALVVETAFGPLSITGDLGALNTWLATANPRRWATTAALTASASLAGRTHRRELASLPGDRALLIEATPWLADLPDGRTAGTATVTTLSRATLDTWRTS